MAGKRMRKKCGRHRMFWQGFVYVISHPGTSGPEPPRGDFWQLYFQEALLKPAKEIRFLMQLLLIQICSA